jgi:hypothetical protein
MSKYMKGLATTTNLKNGDADHDIGSTLDTK